MSINLKRSALRQALAVIERVAVLQYGKRDAQAVTVTLSQSTDDRTLIIRNAGALAYVAADGLLFTDSDSMTVNLLGLLSLTAGRGENLELFHGMMPGALGVNLNGVNIGSVQAETAECDMYGVTGGDREDLLVLNPDTVAAVARNAGTDDTLPILQAVNIACDGSDVVTLTATDRYRMGRVSQSYLINAGTFSANLDARTLTAALKFLGMSTLSRVSTETGVLGYWLEASAIRGSLWILDTGGEFPKVASILDGYAKATEYLMPGADIAAAVKAMMSTAPKHTTFRLSTVQDAWIVESLERETCAVLASHTVAFSGVQAGLSAGLNPEFLLDAIQSSAADCILWTDATKPLYLSGSQSACTVVLMPTRLPEVEPVKVTAIETECAASVAAMKAETALDAAALNEALAEVRNAEKAAAMQCNLASALSGRSYGVPAATRKRAKAAEKAADRRLASASAALKAVRAAAKAETTEPAPLTLGERKSADGARRARKSVKATPARKPAPVRPALPATVTALAPVVTLESVPVGKKARNRALASALRAAGFADVAAVWESAKAGTLAGFSSPAWWGAAA